MGFFMQQELLKNKYLYYTFTNTQSINDLLVTSLNTIPYEGRVDMRKGPNTVVGVAAQLIAEDTAKK